MPPSPLRNPAPSGAVVLTAATRLHHLIEWLRSGRPLTTTLAAEALGVSRRTIARDLAHLRHARGLAVEYEPARRTYRLGRQHAALPFIPHPDLLPAILNGVPHAHADGSSAAGAVRLRFSRRSVQAYEAASGIALSHAVDAEGRLDMQFDQPGSEDLVRWVLSSGAEAEVLAPGTLRRRVVMEIRRMLAVYERGDGDAA